MASRDNEHAPQRHVLADHQAKLCDFGVLEMFFQLGHEGGVHGSEVAGELLREAHRQAVARVELTLGLGQVDLGNRLFIESLTRRRRVACEQSGIALVERCDLRRASSLIRLGATPSV